MLVTEFGIVMDVNSILPLNAYLPMAVTEFGMNEFLHPTIILFVSVSIIALQFSRESYTILPSSTEIDVNPPQPLKAPVVMLVMVLGIVSDVNLLQ